MKGAISGIRCHDTDGKVREKSQFLTFIGNNSYGYAQLLQSVQIILITMRYITDEKTRKDGIKLS